VNRRGLDFYLSIWGIAWINSVGNLAGFVGPALVGWPKRLVRGPSPGALSAGGDMRPTVGVGIAVLVTSAGHGSYSSLAAAEPIHDVLNVNLF
jgi:hypothetical protein